MSPMPPLPSDLVAYKSTPEFTHETVPKGLLAAHCTKAGTWGRIVILEGRLRYQLEQHLDGSALLEGEMGEGWVLEPGQDGSVFPELRHRVEPLGPVRFRVDFLRRA